MLDTNPSLQSYYSRLCFGANTISSRTVRLYEASRKENISGKPLFVAPYVNSGNLSVTVQNDFSRGATTIMEALKEGLAQGRQLGNEITKSLLEVVNEAAEAYIKRFGTEGTMGGFANWVKNNLSPEANDAVSQIMQTGNTEPITQLMTKFSKVTYSVPEITLKNTLISCSAVASLCDDSLEQTPVKAFIKKLVDQFGGNIEADNTSFQYKSPGKWTNSIVDAEGWKDVNRPGTYQVVFGESLYIWGLIPINLTITPSQYITTDGDYFSADVSLTLRFMRTNATKQEALDWLVPVTVSTM